MTKGIREAAYETRQIVELLMSAEPGQSITFAQIREACGMNSINACRGYLSTARKTVRREGLLFEAIRGQGLRRMTDEEIATRTPEWRRKRIRRQSREMVKDLAAVNDFAGLSDEARLSVYVAQTEAAIIDKATSRGAETTLRDASRAKQDQLAIGESLRLLMSR